MTDRDIVAMLTDAEAAVGDTRFLIPQLASPDDLAALCRDALSYRALLREWLETINPYSNASGRCGFCASRESEPHVECCIVRRTQESVA